MGYAIHKAVIPAAGLGTRMAELTKGNPKEMLLLGGEPLIHFSLREASESGMEEVLVVLSEKKRGVESYLRAQSLDIILTLIYQPEPYGLADAICRCREHLENRAFAILLPDAIFFSDVPAIVQVQQAFELYGKSTVGCMRVTREMAPLFGNCGRIEECRPRDERVFEITELQDKERGQFSTMGREEVLRTFPRYVYQPEVFDYIDRTRGKVRGELDDVPVLQAMTKDGKLFGAILDGKGYDVGNPKGYASAEAQVSGKTGEGRDSLEL